MIKLQFKVPEEQLRELRRGSKLLLQVDPVLPPANTVEWTLPTSSKICWEGLNAVQLRDAAFADSDPILPALSTLPVHYTP